MQIKAKQIGNNLIIISDEGKETIVFPSSYVFDKIFSLLYKINFDDSKAALNLFKKEIAKYRKEKFVNKEIVEKRIERKKISKEIKKIQSFDYNKLPVFIPEEWKSLIESKEDSTHIENFLMWLSLCDNQYTRENFLKSFDTKYCYITPKGFIASLRQVWLKEQNDDLYDFVQSKYLQVKTSWKKSPKNFSVVQIDGVYKIEKDTLAPTIGNLDDLYHNYKPIKVNTYTSDYGKRYLTEDNWKVGDIITMPDKATHGEICGIRQYHILQNPHDVITEVHGKYGDTIILTLVNPARLISIEAGWKYTTDQFYFAAVMDKDNVEEQFKEQWGVFEHDYLEESIEDIKKSVIKSKEKEVKLEKSAKIKALKEQVKSLVLGNKTDHLPKELYNNILENRIQLIK